MSDENAKAKAYSLVEKYRKKMEHTLDVSYPYSSIENIDECAKACAIIAVQLVIDNLINCENLQYENDIKYWESVKSAIESM